MTELCFIMSTNLIVVVDNSVWIKNDGSTDQKAIHWISKVKGDKDKGLVVCLWGHELSFCLHLSIVVLNIFM